MAYLLKFLLYAKNRPTFYGAVYMQLSPAMNKQLFYLITWSAVFITSSAVVIRKI
jgi:hypothetical protein